MVRKAEPMQTNIVVKCVQCKVKYDSVHYEADWEQYGEINCLNCGSGWLVFINTPPPTDYSIETA